MKKVLIGLAILVLSSLACQHPDLAQAATEQVSQAAGTVLCWSVQVEHSMK